MIFVVSGPSGSGKGTIVKRVVKGDPLVHTPISWTTRKPKIGEQHGVEYRFTNRKDFLDRARRGEFIEWKVVHGELYGTPKAELDGSRDVLLEIDCQGARTIKESVPKTCTIFVLPPSFSALKERIEKRAMGESAPEVERRLKTACYEIKQVEKFDAWVKNDRIDEATGRILSILSLHRHNVRLKGFRDKEMLERVRATFPAV